VFRDAVTREKISRINVMLGIREDPNYDIEKKLAVMELRMPAELLPIAYDSGGNHLLLDTAEGRRGTIYFLGLESADPDDPPSLDSLSWWLPLSLSYARRSTQTSDVHSSELPEVRRSDVGLSTVGGSRQADQAGLGAQPPDDRQDSPRGDREAERQSRA
jgi:hypothetical protein